MIYIQNTSDIQVIRIPASGPKADGPFTLKIVNTIDKGEGYTLDLTSALIFARLVDSNGAFVHDSEGRQIMVAASGTDQSRLYYIVGLRLDDDVPEGEYEYEARAGETVISTGLLFIGEPTPDVSSYDKPVQYEQYR